MATKSTMNAGVTGGGGVGTGGSGMVSGTQGSNNIPRSSSANNLDRRTNASSPSPSTTGSAPSNEKTAAPVLKVMRLQSPRLSTPLAGMLGGGCMVAGASSSSSSSSSSFLQPSLRLPDSFGTIHTGETFRAYLGVLNQSNDRPVTACTVRASLVTPTARHALPTGSALRDATIPPMGFASAVLSHALEEAGPHVLHVEIRHGARGGVVTKYYRFGVNPPLSIRERTVALNVSGGSDRNNRQTENSGKNDPIKKKYAVSISVENTTSSSLVLDGLDLETIDGYGEGDGDGDNDNHGNHGGSSSSSSSSSSVVALDRPRPAHTATEKYDACALLRPGESLRRLYMVERSQHTDSTHLSASANDRHLGRAVFSWKKTMGEAGTVASTPVLVPSDSTLGTEKSTSTSTMPQVEAIDPPRTMNLGVPHTVRFRVTLPSPSPGSSSSWQLQFRLHRMNGVVVCGRSYFALHATSSSTATVHTVKVRLVALVAGLFSCRGCFTVDLQKGTEVTHPPLFQTFVVRDRDSNDAGDGGGDPIQNALVEDMTTSRVDTTITSSA